jgi:hypothetical protein
LDSIDEKLHSPLKQRLLSKQIHKAHTMQSKGAQTTNFYVQKQRSNRTSMQRKIMKTQRPSPYTPKLLTFNEMSKMKKKKLKNLNLTWFKA